MRSMLARLALSSVCAAVAACGPSVSTPEDGGVTIDGPSSGPCNPIGDDDADGIKNDVEGCQGTPPRDSDGDGTPNYQDRDSDGDGLDDRFEDRNGDGVIGTCTNTCAPALPCPEGQYCSFPDDSGGPGHCVWWECLAGETDPNADDTDGDGTADGVEGGWVCNPRGETNPDGLKPVKYVDSSAVVPGGNPDWRIAIEETAIEGAVGIPAPGALESAFLFDLADPAIQVAGFLVTRPTTATETDAAPTAQKAMQALHSLAGVSGAEDRASGGLNTSLDGFKTVLATTVIVTTSSPSTVLDVRREVVASLLGKGSSTLTYPSMGWTPAATTRFAIVFQTLYRHTNNEVLFMGAVASLTDFDLVTKATGFHVDDAANGTGLTFSGNGEKVECEQWRVSEVPEADILWIVDESGSMSSDRTNVANNANAFFQKATTAGLDFRMGVTDMNDARNGQFARRTGCTTTTGDCWVLPTEAAVFSTNIGDPSGPDAADGGSEHGLTQAKNAISRHLPRNDADPSRIREHAQLVVIFITDERAEELEDAPLNMSDGDYLPNAGQQSAINNFINTTYLPQYTQNDAITHLLGVPTSPTCSNLGEMASGYLELVTPLGGQFGSVCQADLGATLDAIIDDIIGAASPIVLKFYPISATIAVTRDGVAVPRSRSLGWDYRASANAIIFNGMPFNPATPSEIYISYRRWAEQVPVQ